MEWERGWRDHDVERIDALYADGCVFRSAPYRAPQVPREFVERAFSDEDSAEVRFGTPIVNGERAAVEWSAVSTLKSGQVERLAGVSVLRFDAEGLVVEECGYWDSER